MPSALSPDGLELKFNSWHGPADGRFTFAGAGRRYGAGGVDAAGGENSRTSSNAGSVSALGKRGKSQTATTAMAGTPPAGAPTGEDRRPVKHALLALQPKRIEGRRPDNEPNPLNEFVGGVGEGLYDVGKGTVAEVHAALTTNPATTVSNAGREIAAMIDTAIAAEDTPARIQVSRAASAVANASARDIGRATGKVAGNVALAVAPGAALSKAALRRLPIATPRITFDPPQIGWVKETTKSEKPWKSYNDTAPGARAGQAPTLMRTMADGSKRSVKFDGIQGDYMIDRKWAVVNRLRSRAQILRQSEVLAQHRLIGLWEVRTPVDKTKALKLLKQMSITNIHVKVVKP
ncbi:hypothetical protein [Sphingomonas faeni]|uniref:hypothetical protein n=1 Tax=Sphingomonas faeni TaxID=185950 RepID=UPI0020C11869|nr:hypothetical protein [Sphingomonas faeni]MCK8457906.1 hypothetical protein [Sphingomonas faeni]